MRAAVIVTGTMLFALCASAQGEEADPSRTAETTATATAAQADAAPAPAAPAAPAAAAPSAGPMRVIVLDLKGSGVDAAQVEPITGFITVSLSDYPAFEVMSGADVRAMVEFEGEKQAMGCSDDTSCLAEVAGAMGARLVFFGTLGKVGSSYTMVLNLYDSEVGRSAGRTFKRGASLDDMINVVPTAVYETVGPFLQKQGHEVVAPEAAPPPTAAPAAAAQPEASAGGSPMAILLPVGALGLGAAFIGGGVAWDLLVPYSRDKQFQPEWDLWSTVLYAAGAGSAIAGVGLFFFNPLAE
jgi:hypothetical protein